MPNAKPTTSRAARGLAGTVAIPGDKSISHRALMLGALAVGETRVEGLLEGEDVLATAAAMRALGAEVERHGDGTWTVAGVGVGGMAEPAGVLDLGNSGTAARLICGILAGQPFTAFMTGDASLCRRPMNRVIAPLAEMGAQFLSRSGGRMPLAITGAHPLVPIEYDMPVASAQVKSAVLFAGLSAPGATAVIEPKPTRDHSERMLAHFGATVSTEDLPGGRRRVSVQGFPELAGKPIRVPGDISSAAFPLVAALLVPGSAVTLTGVGVNPLRTGLLDTLIEMGADIAVTAARDDGGEPVADIVVKASALKGVEVPPGRAPSMIDEYPILAVAAACAQGTTRMTGLEELRVKESDRLAAIANGLRAAGVRVEDGPDWLAVHGTGIPPTGGALVPANLDHRIAMAFLVLGTVAAKPVSVDDASTIDTSFPGFAALMNGLGANIETGGAA